MRQELKNLFAEINIHSKKWIISRISYKTTSSTGKYGIGSLLLIIISLRERTAEMTNDHLIDLVRSNLRNSIPHQIKNYDFLAKFRRIIKGETFKILNTRFNQVFNQLVFIRRSNKKLTQ